MKLVIPVAGKSSRFPGLRPKWLLNHPNGNLMIVESILGLDLDVFDEIIVICLKEHEYLYSVSRILSLQFKKINLFNKLNIIFIDNSNSQPETIYKGLTAEKINGPIFIKDSDNYFICNPKPGNYVCNISIEKIQKIYASNKSYVELDEKNIIQNIVEKKVISNTFCVGGYVFNDANEFVYYYTKLKDIPDLYVSHIIYQMILDGKLFLGQVVDNFIDWGTVDDWNSYKNKFCTIFLDLDGVVVENSGEFTSPYWGETNAIVDNVNVLNKLYETKRIQIIITTSRSKNFKEATEIQLKKIGLNYDHIIFELFHAKRLLINDFSNSNPYRSCDAINLSRNSSELKLMLNSIINMEDIL